MRAFLEEYGIGIFILIIVTALVSFASIAGINVKEIMVTELNRHSKDKPSSDAYGDYGSGKEYLIIEGADQVYESGTLTFMSDMEFEIFDKVIIDGVVINSNNYDATSDGGNTRITFKNGFSSDLIRGGYTFKLLSNDNKYAKCNFSVKRINLIESDYAGQYIWKDGTNTYYSYYDIQLVSVNGIMTFDGRQVWSDGTNTYLGSEHVLTGDKWKFKNMNNSSFLCDDYVWTDGINTYFSYGSKQYILKNGVWEEKTWTGLTDFDGTYIWTDGTNTYYSCYDEQYVLNGNTWSTKTWNGYNKVNGSLIWTDGSKYYFSDGNGNNKVLNGDTWESKTWEGYNKIWGNLIWTDGTNTYYDDSYVLKNGKWESKTWGGYQNFNSDFIWTDGTNIYYSDEEKQYILNGNTWEDIIWYCLSDCEHSTFINKTWTGLNDFSGENIWTDGTNIYYSNEVQNNGTTGQYILKNGQWEPKNWSGFAPKYGENIWTDGTNIYYSQSSIQYVLNGNTWEPKIWEDLTDFDGYNIWTDGTNIYYSDNSQQYVLKNGQWEPKNWSGFAPKYGDNIWTAGTNIYYSQGSTQYVLSGNTWEPKTWNVSGFYGCDIWTIDGFDYYCSAGPS